MRPAAGCICCMPPAAGCICCMPPPAAGCICCMPPAAGCVCGMPLAPGCICMPPGPGCACMPPGHAGHAGHEGAGPGCTCMPPPGHVGTEKAVASSPASESTAAATSSWRRCCPLTRFFGAPPRRRGASSEGVPSFLGGMQSDGVSVKSCLIKPSDDLHNNSSVFDGRRRSTKRRPDIFTRRSTYTYTKRQTDFHNLLKKLLTEACNTRGLSPPCSRLPRSLGTQDGKHFFGGNVLVLHHLVGRPGDVEVDDV